MATPYSGYEKPADGAQNAGEDFNSNFDILDGVGRVKATCGEAMTQWYAGYMASNEKIYIADSSATPTTWVIGFVEETTAQDADEYFKKDGIITNASWSFSDIGKPVYLSTNGGLSQSAGTVERKVGTAWASNKLLINITF